VVDPGESVIDGAEGPEVDPSSGGLKVEEKTSAVLVGTEDGVMNISEDSGCVYAEDRGVEENMLLKKLSHDC
jgi:hypothetical protein